MGVAASFGEAFAKAQLSAGHVLPTGGTVFFSVNDHDKPAAIELARRYVHSASRSSPRGNANALEHAGLSVERSSRSRREDRTWWICSKATAFN